MGLDVFPVPDGETVCFLLECPRTVASARAGLHDTKFLCLVFDGLVAYAEPFREGVGVRVRIVVPEHLYLPVRPVNLEVAFLQAEAASHVVGGRFGSV